MSDPNEANALIEGGRQHPLYGQRVEIYVSRWRQLIRLLAASAGAAFLWDLLDHARRPREWPDFLVASLGLSLVWIGMRVLREIVRLGPRMIVSAEGFHDRSIGVMLPWDAFFIMDVDIPLLPRTMAISVSEGAARLLGLPLWRRALRRLLGRSRA